MKKTIVILFSMIVIASSCYRDVEEELYAGGGSCDTTGVAYATTVVPILQSNGCLGCHSGAGASGGISLQTYSEVKAAAAGGKLYGAINHSPGYSPMPKGGNKLSACNITKIKAWIDAGSLNN